MSEAKVIFTLDSADLTIQCSSDDKMKDICQKYVSKLDKNIGSFSFLYGGIQVNFDLSFKDHANSLDRANNQMNVLVYQNENEIDVNLNKEISLNKIKSVFCIQEIFSFLDEKVKLESIRYNKKLQNINHISLINYKFFSGRYLIYQSKTKGKEFDGYTDKLKFEGEYLNGKRNGNGKEYNYRNGSLYFEGEYKNGKRNGKGKEYDWHSGNLTFEGEYLNGNRWNGKGYFQSVYIVYELKEGKGDVKEFYEDGKLKFEGEYKNGKRCGKGKEYESNGKLKFDGEYLNGKRWNGKGYDENNVIVYELKKGKGHIKEYFHANLEFEGEFLNGEKNGKGKKYNILNGKLIFEGEYKNGKINGKGKEYFIDKLVFDGEYLYDYKIKGKEYIDGRLEFEGYYLFDRKWNGKGYDEKGNVVYELINGTGKVKEYHQNGTLMLDGEYLNGKRHGKVKEYFNNGKLKFEGEYLNGRRNGKGIEGTYYGNSRFEVEYLDGEKISK